MAPKSLELSPVPYRFLKSQLAKPVPLPKDVRLTGQTAIVTGANAGIGYECANTLLEMGLGRLIIAARTLSRGEAAAERLREKHKSAHIEAWQMDLLSHKSVQGFAAKCEMLDRIDVAILNAGTAEQTYKQSPEGHEVQLQVNYLSTVLLAFLLLPTLKVKSPPGKPGRMTIVNSGTALMAKFPKTIVDPLKFYDEECNFDPLNHYAITKALAHFWIRKLVQLVQPEDVVVNLADPGLVKGTGLHRNTNFIVNAIFGVVKRAMGRTMEQGASAILNAAVVCGEETHGSFLMDWRIFPYTEVAYGPEGEALADRLWNETVSALSFANIDGNLASMSH